MLLEDREERNAIVVTTAEVFVLLAPLPFRQFGSFFFPMERAKGIVSLTTIRVLTALCLVTPTSLE